MMSSNTMRNSLRLLAGTIVGAMLAAPAVGQQPADESSAEAGLDEVTVTAQRRAESVQDVPIAISAFSADQLEALNVTDALDVMQYIPNVVSHNNTGLGSANAYYIRGLGGTESLATADPPVGTYVDEIYISRQSANNLSLFDVSRVEVMRGPQGTLFGRNTTGGAINVVMSRPGETRSGYVEAGFGSWSERSIRASIDLPLSDRVRTKISGYWNEDDGYVKNITTGERVNDESGKGVRFALEAGLTDSLQWNVAALYSENFSANLVNFDCNPANPADCGGRFVSTGLLRNNGGANQLAPLNVANGKGNLPLGAETRFTLVSSDFEFQLGGVTFNAISGYVKTEQDFLVDFFDGRAAPTISFAADPVTGLPTRYNTGSNVVVDTPVRGLRAGGFVIANLADSEQFTQEIKVSGSAFGEFVDYVGGLFYYDEKNVTDFADTLSSVNATTGVITSTLLADRIVRNGTQAYAGYAQLDFNLSDAWKLTTGIRYTDERKDYAFSDNRAICQVTPLPAACIDSRNFASVDVDLNPATPNVTIPLKQQVKLWTPRFAVNYAPNDDVLIFASATRGFKSGAQAGRATLVRQLLPVGPEKVWSYELGAKTEWFDRRLRLNTTLFLQDTEDFQAGTAFVNPTTGALAFVTRNLADMENRGLEIELVAQPIEALTLTLSAGLQDIEFKIDPSKPAIDQFNFLSPAAQQAECRAALAGQASPRGNPGTAVARAQGSCSGIITNTGDLAEPVRAPDLTVTAGVAYRIPLGGSGWSLTPAVTLLYTGDQEVGTNNLSAFRNSAGVLNFARDGEFILGSFSEAHTLVNFNLALRSSDDRWLISASCDNCSDEIYPQATLSNFSYVNPSASWAVKARLKF
jgi:iron complex outermembrane receptor protein